MLIELSVNNSGDTDQSLRRLMWVCKVCLCPIKRTLGLYGLNKVNPKSYFGLNRNFCGMHQEDNMKIQIC